MTSYDVTTIVGWIAAGVVGIAAVFAVSSCTTSLNKGNVDFQIAQTTALTERVSACVEAGGQWLLAVNSQSFECRRP